MTFYEQFDSVFTLILSWKRLDLSLLPKMRNFELDLKWRVDNIEQSIQKR